MFAPSWTVTAFSAAIADVGSERLPAGPMSPAGAVSVLHRECLTASAVRKDGLGTCRMPREYVRQVN